MTPFIASSWSEEDARAEFRKLRFARWGGLPACERCDNPGVITYKKRPIYKCKMCGRQFSDTSGTPWGHRKLSFKKLMYIVACFVANKQAKTAMSLCEDIGVQYKTALLWLHRLRAQLADAASKASLAGEVEVDGAEIGGFIRPKNSRKTKKDHRKFPYKAKDRKFHLIAARQRGGGPIRTWIGREEAHAVSFVSDAMLKGTTVYTDMAAHWSRLRARFRLFQVNHNEHFYTPEACTNQVESLWALVRVMGRVHRHIAQQYLDLYVAEAAWTLRKASYPAGKAFEYVMACMSVAGPSPLVGYYQGRKRSMPVCNKDGTVTAWKPDPNRRPMRPRPDGTFEAVRTRKPLDKTWHEGFEFVEAAEALNDPTLLPNKPGVYAIFLRNAEGILEAAAHIDRALVPMWKSGEADHLYSGETIAIRERLLAHLRGNIADSNFRATIMSLTADERGCFESYSADAEERLTATLRADAVVGFKVCHYVKDVETAILMATASPMNVARPNPTASTRQIKQARSAFKDTVGAAWPTKTSSWMPRR